MSNFTKSYNCLKKPIYSWYAVYTRPNREKKIAEKLNEENIECYLPLRRSLHHWSDRKKWIEEPLFRCYVFVKVSHLEFFDVLNSDGVVNYIKFGGKAQSIPNYQIENIKTFIKQRESEFVVTREKISKGLKAIVHYGPMKGVQGEVVQIYGQSRIMIRIETLGCCLYTNISKDEVVFVQQEPDNNGHKHEMRKNNGHHNRKLISY